MRIRQQLRLTRSLCTFICTAAIHAAPGCAADAHCESASCDDAEGCAGAGCDDASTADGDTGHDRSGDASRAKDFRLVSIESWSDTWDYWGPEIDAVVLEKPSGATFYATEERGLWFAGGTISDGPPLNPAEVLGPPDAYVDYPDLSRCPLEDDVWDNRFAVLGGSGGEVVVELPVPIEDGDVLTVLELAHCELGSGDTAVPEKIRVMVTTPSAFDWHVLGFGSGPEATFVISELPECDLYCD